ncbi:MAG: enoyl-CoA hydratase-related protein [Planctomycetota bacterium]
MSETLVQAEALQAGVTLLTLNRPDKRNALSGQLMRDLIEAVRKVEADENQRVLILRGAGKVFCAGLDLAEAKAATDPRESAELVGEMLRTVYETPLITVAAVHGAAIAGGAGLMSACDFVIGEEGSKIGYPEVHRGLVAALVLGLLCTQVPRRVARELLLLGEIIDAEHAAQIGLITQTCPVDESQSLAKQVARKILLGGPKAVRLSKQALNDFSGQSFRDSLASALDGHLAARDSSESQEGFAAFLEKRPPSWQPTD